MVSTGFVACWIRAGALDEPMCPTVDRDRGGQDDDSDGYGDSGPAAGADPAGVRQVQHPAPHPQAQRRADDLDPRRRGRYFVAAARHRRPCQWFWPHGPAGNAMAARCHETLSTPGPRTGVRPHGPIRHISAHPDRTIHVLEADCYPRLAAGNSVPARGGRQPRIDGQHRRDRVVVRGECSASDPGRFAEPRGERRIVEHGRTAFASASASPGGTRIAPSGPVSSGVPPTLVATIGRPRASPPG